MFLAAAVATAGMLFAIVASDGSNPLAAPRRDDRLFGLGLLAFGFASLIALPGGVLTLFYLRRPYGWMRGAYRVLLFLIVVTWMVNFMTGARVFTTRSVCWDCGFEAWSIQTVVPASLFIALAPPVQALLARYAAARRTQQGLRRRAVLLRDGLVESLFGRPAHGATYPRVTLWLAAVPCLNWLMGNLIVASEGRSFGNAMLMAIPIVYSAAFFATLIVTPLLGYLAIRYLRDMPRAAKAWMLLGLLAGAWCYTLAAEAYSLVM